MDELPFHAILPTDDPHPLPPDELSPEITNELSPLLAELDSSLDYSAAYAFLYMFISLCPKSTPGGLTFTMRSTLPVGAGLGSSASMSVCLASAFSYLGGHIKEASLVPESKVAKDSDECIFIDRWAFMGEKCIHGNPSGIDNAVATHGGAVMFQRMGHTMPSVRTAMRNLPPINLLLVNTKTPRRTANLVAGVSQVIADYPHSGAHILEAMDAIAKEAYNVMLRPRFDKEGKEKLMNLVRINHGLLIALGVSHPNLERIRVASDELQIGETKLTGAGGGGCAITLLKDGVTPDQLEQMHKRMDEYGFETFHTTLGGKGVGILQTEDPDLLKLLTVDSFKQMKGRQEVEQSIGCSVIDEWRYW